MNTYRIFVIEVASDNTLKATHTLYGQGDKYGDAWQAARGLLNDGKAHPKQPAVKALFLDAERTKPWTGGFGDHLTVAKVVDIKPRNVKLDKAALLEAANADGTPEEKLAKMMAMLGIKAPAPAEKEGEKKPA